MWTRALNPVDARAESRTKTAASLDSEGWGAAEMRLPPVLSRRIMHVVVYNCDASLGVRTIARAKVMGDVIQY
jgi:hypothetical protein